MQNAQPFTTPYQDRREAGRALAQRLLAYRDGKDALVLALSADSAPIADEIANTLERPLDIFLVRDVALPGYEDLSMGFVARGVHVADEAVLERAGIVETMFLEAADVERDRIEQLELAYRNGAAAAPIAGRIVLLVAESLTKAADLAKGIAALRRHVPAKIVLAVPVADLDAVAALATKTDDIVIDRTLDAASALESWFEDSAEVDDETIRITLEHAAERLPA